MQVSPEQFSSVLAQAKCLYNYSEVNVAIEQMAQQIHAKLADANPIIICVMTGGLVTTGKLLPLLAFPLELDYLHATRYRNNTGHAIEWLSRPTKQLAGRTLLIVDDILDGGITLASITEFCRQQGAAQIYTAVLANKQSQREPGGMAQADFAALKVPDLFLFGCGMDYHGYLRNAPGIYAVV